MMKKLSVILLFSFFAIGLTSCAEESIETDPAIPEISNVADHLENQKTTERKIRKRDKAGVRTSS